MDSLSNDARDIVLYLVMAFVLTHKINLFILTPSKSEFLSDKIRLLAFLGQTLIRQEGGERRNGFRERLERIQRYPCSIYFICLYFSFVLYNEWLKENPFTLHIGCHFEGAK